MKRVVRRVLLLSTQFRAFPLSKPRSEKGANVNSLREISAFVGVQPRSMRGVGDLIPILSDDAKTSMRSMIRELQSLPDITLEAEAVGNRFGDAPFRPTFRIHPSLGAVTKTEIILFANGAQPDLFSIVGNSGDFTPFTLRFPVFSFCRSGEPGCKAQAW